MARPKEIVMINQNRLRQDIEKFLEELLEGGADVQYVETALSGLYDNLVENFRPLLQAMPSLAIKVQTDLCSLIVAFLTARNAFWADERTLELASEGDRLKATRRYNTLQSYLAAGFTRPEAMALLLQDVANAKSAVSGVSTSLRQARMPRSGS